MRSLLAIWLVTLFSLANLSAVNQPKYPTQTGNTITVEEYWNLVENTHEVVVRLQSQPKTEVPSQLEALASQWDQVTAVELSDHDIVPIHSIYLTKELRNPAPDLKHLEKSLNTLLHAHEQFPQKVFTLEDVDPLKAILARPEFQWKQLEVTETPDWLKKLFDFTDRIGFGLANLLYQGRYVFMILAAALFALSLFYISRNLSRSLVREAELAAEQNENDAILTSKGALQRAQTLSMHGDYRNAIRYLYLSSLLVLDEQGLLRYDRSRTNREYLRSVSSHPELAKPLRDVIDVFDRVWYGFESVDEQTYQSYIEHVEELREKKD